VPQPETEINNQAKIIDIIMKFDEGKQYYVRRIDFTGNTTTRDKVIRRQLLIDEGQLFNKRAWELSILRLNQLDYFDKLEADKAAEIKRNPKEGTVDLLLKLKEKGKQSIGLQGGVSGLYGGFIGLTYQTNNFLGLGETLTLSAQFGNLQRSLMFGFTEPYLFDRPISTGFTIFSNEYKFNQAQQAALTTGQSVSINPQYIQDYTQNSAGFTIFASYPLRRYAFTRVAVSYGLTRTNITTYNQASELLFTQLQYQSIAGPAALNGILSSTITPTISYNTINNPCQVLWPSQSEHPLEPGPQQTMLNSWQPVPRASTGNLSNKPTSRIRHPTLVGNGMNVSWTAVIAMTGMSLNLRRWQRNTWACGANMPVQRRPRRA
jgi:outer membrane protein insertion porin family